MTVIAGHFELAGRQFPRKTWYKDAAMRKTYIILMFVVLTSATNGYDGSMMNGLQTLQPWQDYFGHPTGSRIGYALNHNQTWNHY